MSETGKTAQLREALVIAALNYTTHVGSRVGFHWSGAGKALGEAAKALIEEVKAHEDTVPSLQAVQSY